MFKFPMPPRPKPLPEGERPKLQKLFESYAHGTLALMGVAAGLIALATLALEIFFGVRLTEALGLPFAYMSMPMGAATVILGGLMARASWTMALPALLMGIAYWAIVALV